MDQKKNIVIVGGSNVYPAELEKILDESPEIAEAAVVGCPDPDTGEAVVACIRPCDPGWRDEKAVRLLFDGKLAAYQHPSHILFMDDFPRTSLGKVQKVALAGLVQGKLISG